MVGVAAHGSTQGRKFSDMRVVFFCVGDRPLRAMRFERALDGRPAAAKSIEDALGELDADLPPRADLHGSAATKLHLAKVLAGRVLKSMEGVAS
jgi:carbon-monoxide dehydrogenase medium subunit